MTSLLDKLTAGCKGACAWGSGRTVYTRTGLPLLACLAGQSASKSAWASCLQAEGCASLPRWELWWALLGGNAARLHVLADNATAKHLQGLHADVAQPKKHETPEQRHSALVNRPHLSSRYWRV